MKIDGCETFNIRNQNNTLSGFNSRIFLFILITSSFFIIINLPLTSSASFTSLKTSDSYERGETLLTKFSGNFIEQPAEADIIFYRGHVQIPVVFEMEKISGEFYLYALLTGKSAGNYSISVENTVYRNGTEISEQPFFYNFTIASGLAEFSLQPGFVNANNSFNLQVQNLQSGTITIQINTSAGISSADSTNLLSGQTKDIEFTLNNPSETETITLSSGDTSYSVPVFLQSGSGTTGEEGEGEKSFRFEPKTISVSMATESDTKRIIYLLNTGEEDLEDITLFVSSLLEPYVTLSREEVNDLEVNTTEKIELSIISDAEEAILEGKLFASAENATITASMPFILDFIKDFVPEEDNVSEEPVSTTTCSDLDGVICQEGTECSNDPELVKDGVCCLATCQEIEEDGGSTGKIIGWTLVVLIVIFVIWFFKKKYRGVKSNVNLLNIAKGRK